MQNKQICVLNEKLNVLQVKNSIWTNQLYNKVKEKEEIKNKKKLFNTKKATISKYRLQLELLYQGSNPD